MRVVASDLHFGEAPRWHQGKLWFSDFYDHAVKTVDLDGNVETKVDVPGQPSGLGWLPDGRLLVVSMTDRSLLRQEYGHLVVHADLSGIADFHCNDMVVDASGRAYVGNFGFDLDRAILDDRLGEAIREHEGAKLARVDPDGSTSVAATGLMFPNGAVITPDGRTMIIAETAAGRLTAFDVAADGTLSKRRVWAELGRRYPDGICLDAEGAVWVADAEANQCVRVRQGGTILDTIETDRRCFACMLGGPDGRSLFLVTARESLAATASQQRTGQIVVTDVQVGHAGRP